MNTLLALLFDLFTTVSLANGSFINDLQPVPLKLWGWSIDHGTAFILYESNFTQTKDVIWATIEPIIQRAKRKKQPKEIKIENGRYKNACDLVKKTIVNDKDMYDLVVIITREGLSMKCVKTALKKKTVLHLHLYGEKWRSRLLSEKDDIEIIMNQMQKTPERDFRLPKIAELNAILTLTFAVWYTKLGRKQKHFKSFSLDRQRNEQGSVWSVGLTITTICAVAILVACLAGLITAVLNSRKQHAIEEKALLLRPKAQKAQFTESAIEWDDSVKSDSSTEMAMSTDI